MPPSGSCYHIPVSSACPCSRLTLQLQKIFLVQTSTRNGILLLQKEKNNSLRKKSLIPIANDRTVKDLNETDTNFLLKSFKILIIF